MKIQISIAIRFSLLSELQSTAYETGLKLGYEEHKKGILSPENLTFRVNIFEKICLPSLVQFNNLCQKDRKNTVFNVFLVTSDLIDEQTKNYLVALCSIYNFLRVEFQSEQDANVKRPLIRQAKKFKEKTLFVTMRMDDDDAISNDFYHQLKPYLNEQFSGYALTLGMGYAMVIDNNINIQGFYDFYKPKIAICLAYITVIDPEIGLNRYNTVYCLSRHMRVDIRVPTISDCRKHSFIRTVHIKSDLFSDISRFDEAIASIDHNITIENVKSRFNLP